MEPGAPKNSKEPCHQGSTSNTSSNAAEDCSKGPEQDKTASSSSSPSKPLIYRPRIPRPDVYHHPSSMSSLSRPRLNVCSATKPPVTNPGCTVRRDATTLSERSSASIGNQPQRSPNQVTVDHGLTAPVGSASCHARASADKSNYNKRGFSRELNRGPRFSVPDDDNPLSRRTRMEKALAKLSIRPEKYNLPDFKTEYEEAKFYIIKSFCEDDVHKSIKYGVWSSTRHGNSKLDAAFLEADERAGEAEEKCPIFLYFSVNSSGQFLGVAEMTGRVDFVKRMQFWMDDLWEGFFPVRWRIIKDVPNRLFSHIVNNDRCVTFSRDTQEIGLEQGLEMLQIFQKYSERTSLLDDFYFYEERATTRR